MGNRYYKGYRRFNGGRKKGKKVLLFFCGGLLVLVAAFALFSDEENALKSAFAKGSARVAAVCSKAVDWGKETFGMESASFALPVNSGVVVEEFGVVADVDGNEAYHNGIDIQVPAGSEALSAADGKVTDVSKHDDGTFWVTVSHYESWSTVYGRLGESYVAVGDEVKKGTAIGVPKNEILHFEVLEDEKEKDPVSYLEKGTDG